jgi:DNA modification methylase
MTHRPEQKMPDTRQLAAWELLQKGMLQRDIAKQLDVAESTISKWLSHVRSLDIKPSISENGYPLTSTLSYEANKGAYYTGDSAELLQSEAFSSLQGKVQLIFTSPPFPLNEKKSYGNKEGKEYLDWFESLAPIFSKMLSDDGSIVLEVGNSWEPGRPVQSLLALKSLLAFTEQKDSKLRLIQQFVCYNPSRLPTPAAWVTRRRIRAVDSFTHLWWLSKTDEPKANTSNVLRPYSDSMKSLLKRGSYNAGKRPSQHQISIDGFLKNNGGSIPHNLIEFSPIEEDREVRLPNTFSFSNTVSNDFFHKSCKENDIVPHPARMYLGLAYFFVEFLTTQNDIVLDPFAGSNTTGFAAALGNRRWVSIDISNNYVKESKLRFEDPKLNKYITKEK